MPNSPSDTGFGFEYLSDELIEGWFDIRNKIEYKVPTLPGLGVDINRDKLKKYTVHKEEWSPDFKRIWANSPRPPLVSSRFS